MSRALAALGRRFGARVRGVDERTPATATNTQFLVQLSGYAWVVRTLGPLAGRAVLDVATGEGYGADVLAAAGARVVGVDVDAGVVARARRAHPRARFAVMDGARLGLRPAAFDVVVSQDTLEHVEDDAGFVAEMARVLKPGGRLVLFTPHARVHTLRPANPFHLREYSPSSLLALLGRHFEGLALWGRRAGATLEAAEAEMNRVRRYDPLGLRRLLVPGAVRHRVGSWLARRRTAVRLDELSTGDVEYFEGVADTGTLIAVGVKPARRA